jgi:hypothetical protein
MTDNTAVANGQPFDALDPNLVAWVSPSATPIHQAPNPAARAAERALFIPPAGQTTPGNSHGSRSTDVLVKDVPLPTKPARTSRKRRRKEQVGPDSVSKKVERRNRQVAEAAQLRVHETDPDVVAWRVERTQRVVEIILYTGIVCGLAFTMVNVQHFAAGDRAWSSPAWWAAWVLDPTVSAVLIGILIAGKALARNGIRLGRWARTAGAITVVATYTMNTWESWASGMPSQIVLHSIPPLVVFVAVEVLAELRELFAKAVFAAHAQAETLAADQFTNKAAREPFANSFGAIQSVNSLTGSAPGRTANDAFANYAGPVHEQRTDKRSTDRPRKQSAKRSLSTPSRRRMADFVADAEAAYAPGVKVTPEWVQENAGCSRTSAFAVIKQLRTSLPDTAFANDSTDSPYTPPSVNQSVNQSANSDGEGEG